MIGSFDSTLKIFDSKILRRTIGAVDIETYRVRLSSTTHPSHLESYVDFTFEYLKQPELV